MPARAARGDNDVVDLEQVFLRDVQTTELGEPFFENQSAAHGVFYRGRLLEDFLQHEVRIATALNLLQVPVDARHGLIADRRVEIEHPVATARHDGDIAVVEIDHVACVRQNSRRVGGDEVLAVTDADQQRAAFSGGHDLVLFVARDHGKTVRAVALTQRLDYCGFEVAGIRHLDEMGEHFGVGVGLAHVAARFQSRLQGGGILNDAIVHHGDLAVLARVRVRILFGWRTVGGPAGVRDTHRTLRRILRDRRFEPGDLARRAARFHAFAVHDGDARRVVATILEALEPFEQHGGGDAITNVADDSAHGRSRSRVIRAPTAAPGPA